LQASRQQAVTCSCKKEKKYKKITTNGIKVERICHKNYIAKKIKLPWCSPAAWALLEFGHVGAISEALVEFDDDHLQDLDPTCPHTF